MRQTPLEELVPGLKEARDAEHQNRSVCFAGIPWTVAGFELVPFTPRHKLELTLVRNRFFVLGELPRKEDVAQILWRLHPAFRARPPSVAVSWARVRLWLRLRRMTRAEVMEVALAIADYLGAMTQDLPEATSGGSGSGGNHVHWLASELAFYLQQFHGFTWQSYMDTPYLVLQQLFRAYRLSASGNTHFINRSDAMLGQWLKQKRCQ